MSKSLSLNLPSLCVLLQIVLCVLFLMLTSKRLGEIRASMACRIGLFRNGTGTGTGIEVLVPKGDLPQNMKCMFSKEQFKTCLDLHHGIRVLEAELLLVDI